MSGAHRRPHCDDSTFVKLMQQRIAEAGGHANETEIAAFLGFYFRTLRDVLESGRNVHLRGGPPDNRIYFGMLDLKPMAARRYKATKGFGKHSEGETEPKYQLVFSPSPEIEEWAKKLGKGGK